MSSKIINKIGKLQQSLILLLFVSALLIFLDLGLFSFSFLIGLFLITLTLNKTPSLTQPKGLMWYLFAFLIAAAVSILFSEISIKFIQIKFYIQTIYWFLLAVIVSNIYPFINKRSLSKYVLGATILLLILYVVGFRKNMPQNFVAFSAIISAPLGYYYLNKNWQKILLAIILFFLLLLNGSRTGALVCLLQAILILLLTIPFFTKYIKLSLLAITLAILFLNLEPVRKSLGSAVLPYNQELGLLLKNPDLVMSTDKSWLIRKAQIQKGKQIFKEHPILGIGYFNFVNYEVKMNLSEIGIKFRAKNIDNRSAHNSYIAILSETGILGFLPIMFFFLLNLIYFFRYINNIGNSFEACVFVSFIGLLIYFYTISSFVGTSSWIMYGLIYGASKFISSNYKTINKIV